MSRRRYGTRPRDTMTDYGGPTDYPPARATRCKRCRAHVYEDEEFLSPEGYCAECYESVLLREPRGNPNRRHSSDRVLRTHDFFDGLTLYLVQSGTSKVAEVRLYDHVEMSWIVEPHDSWRDILAEAQEYIEDAYA